MWAFGVTLWEILTYAREQPYEELTDKEVVETLQELEEADLMEEILHQPYNCPRDVYELMLECWAKHTEDRPDFQVVAQIFNIPVEPKLHNGFCRKFHFF